MFFKFNGAFFIVMSVIFSLIGCKTTENGNTSETKKIMDEQPPGFPMEGYLSGDTSDPDAQPSVSYIETYTETWKANCIIEGVGDLAGLGCFAPVKVKGDTKVTIKDLSPDEYQCHLEAIQSGVVSDPVYWDARLSIKNKKSGAVIFSGVLNNFVVYFKSNQKDKYQKTSTLLDGKKFSKDGGLDFIDMGGGSLSVTTSELAAEYTADDFLVNKIIHTKIYWHSTLPLVNRIHFDKGEFFCHF